MKLPTGVKFLNPPLAFIEQKVRLGIIVNKISKLNNKIFFINTLEIYYKYRGCEYKEKKWLKIKYILYYTNIVRNNQVIPKKKYVYYNSILISVEHKTLND